jgi:hypothetical protein
MGRRGIIGEEVKKSEYIEEVLGNGGDTTKAIKKVYGIKSSQSIKSKAEELATDEDVRDRIRNLLELRGIDLEYLNDKLAEMLEGEKAIVVDKDVVYVKDNGVRLEAMKVGYKLHGLLSNDIKVDNRQVSINMNEEDAIKLMDIAKGIEELNKELELGNAENGEI